MFIVYFFCFIFRYFKVWKCHFFRQGFLFCFTYMTLFLWQGHSLKICMTTSQLMRVINDVRIINIDNWIVEINRISAVKIDDKKATSILDDDIIRNFNVFSFLSQHLYSKLKAIFLHLSEWTHKCVWKIQPLHHSLPLFSISNHFYT